MNKSKNGHGDVGRLRRLMPALNDREQEMLRNALNSALGSADGGRLGTASALREVGDKWKSDGQNLTLQACCHLFADLYEQGWIIRCETDFILEPPGLVVRTGEDVSDVKKRIRDGLLAGRNRQLQEDSVQAFFGRMSRKVNRPEGKHSIASVIDNGEDLVLEIKRCLALPTDKCEQALSKLIKPEVEVVDGTSKCASTGLRLIDIWRFFRHTWSLEYRPIPGRQLPILIRNAARPNRPVMGIAMLASPVMRLKVRDELLGWTLDAVAKNLFRNRWQAKDFAVAVWDRLNQSISEIRSDDLISPDELEQPDHNTIITLQRAVIRASSEREELLKEQYEESGGSALRYGEDPATFGDDAGKWLEASSDPLFVKKRAETLSALIEAKRVLSESGLIKDPTSAMRQLLTSKKGSRALETVLTEFRKVGLASHVMDVSVCGAVAPYNALLGGKLTALMLASREVEVAYNKRYGANPSLIASQMAGRPIVRDASLKFLTTTSLFGVGSSQYNRLALTSEDHRGIAKDIRWKKIGDWSAGFGTAHLSTLTSAILRELSVKAHGARRVNNRFGEGASPRLRQIREGLDAIGIQSDRVLQHATPRLVFGCELVDRATEQLLWMAEAKTSEKASAKAIARAWKKRWLFNRIQRDDVLDKVRREGPEQVLNSLIDPSRRKESEPAPPFTE